MNEKMSGKEWETYQEKMDEKMSGKKMGKGYQERYLKDGSMRKRLEKNGVIMKKDWKSVDIKKNGKSFESGKNEKNVYVRKWKNSVLRNEKKR